MISLLSAVVLRLYNIQETMMFLGDQGRDALIVSQIFKELDPVFIGPVTSLGNMYLGPLYYYFMVPFLYITYPSPLGPAVAVAILGILTVFLTYCFGKKMVGETAAVFATILMAFSSVLVEYSRFSWNPNPTPLVQLCMVYATYLSWKKSPKYWWAVVACFGVLVQLHYMTLLSAGGAGIIWLISLYQSRNNKKSQLLQLKSTAVGVVIFLALLSPLFLFELRYPGVNTEAFIKIFTSENTFSNSEPPIEILSLFLFSAQDRFLELLFETFFTKLQFSQTLAIIITIAAFLSAFRRTTSKYRNSLITLLAYFSVIIIGVGLYRHSVFDHYILFVLPISALLLGFLAAELIRMWKVFAYPVFLILTIFVYINLSRMPLLPQGMTVADYKTSASEISEQLVAGEKYNIVLLSATRDLYGQNYRYFLNTVENKSAVNPEREVVVDTLVIINEEKLVTADTVLDLPIYQIQIFPNKSIQKVITLSTGIEVYIMRSE